MSTTSTTGTTTAVARAPEARAASGAGARAYLAHAAGKLGGAAVSLIAVLVTSFFLFRIIPGDPVKAMTHGVPTSAEQMATLRRQFGLDQPLWQQFTDYCAKALTGDLGMSYQFRAPVGDLILQK